MKEKGSHLDITLESNCVFLKGTGVDVEPAYLTGQVALTLTEPTSLKEITLQFRGKARLPVPASESLMNNNAHITYTVCNHDWSFLEGDKKHTRTLKEGRHVFPFQLRIGGSLPSSIAALESEGASVSYRLRAQATRPGFNHNIQATALVHVIRSLSEEALEYQQTLEIENTWPEKLMYSIMLPHKAWAAGDTLAALVKFSPLNKRISVVRITTSLHETTSVYARSGSQTHVRVVASVKQDIMNGRGISSDGVPAAGGHQGHTGSNSTLNGSHAQGDQTEILNNDIVTTLTMPLPLTLTATHGVDPIVTSHRVRWSIIIANPDGHTSELRCSLPVHILDARLLQEAKRHTAHTRRLLLGGPDIPNSEEDEEMELPSYTSHMRDRVAGVALPDIGFSNTSTASSSGAPLTPDGNVTLHGGPGSGHSTPLEPNVFSHLPHIPASGDNTSLEWITSELLLQQWQQQRHFGTGHRTSYFVPDEHTDSDVSRPASRAPSRPGSRHSSRAASRCASPDPHRTASGSSSSGSRRGFAHSDSRNSSTLQSREGHGARNLHGLLKATMKPFTSITHGHWHSRPGGSHGNLVDLPDRQPGSRPQSSRRQSLTLSPITFDASSNGQNSQHQQQIRTRSTSMVPPQLSSSTASTSSSPSTAGSAFFLPGTLTEVPNYDVASRGFIGGLPPLTSLQGLPSYEEAALSTPPTPLRNTSAEGGLAMYDNQRRLTQAQRARSEPDLVTRMAGTGLRLSPIGRQS
ncbi:hypothetical protein F5887DRAFT_896713 [Amanita rubescens]|nr:hypothetical protein F5887DRAFT_896713 [Amanita rubescens]